MITIHIKPKSIAIQPILPFELSDGISREVKELAMNVVNENFEKIERLIYVKQNYSK